MKLPVAFLLESLYLVSLLHSLLAADGIPIIGIQSWTKPGSYNQQDRLETAAKVGQACQEIGFFAIRNHGVNESVVNRAWRAASAFFDLPLSTKLAWKTHNETEYPYGYEQSERLIRGKKQQQAATTDSDSTPADLKETFSIGPSNPQSGMPPRQFPDEPVELQSALEDYYMEMEQLALTLLRIFAVALDLPDDWFQSKMDHHMSALRILNYFDIDASQVKPGVLRASEHTDYGALTILLSGGPGLQVKMDVEADEWVDVPYLPDAFIINIGDLMQRWTNDKWVSTLHRVVLPPLEEGKVSHRRQSIAFFCNINGDTVVTPLQSCVDDDTKDSSRPRYPPITARQHLMAKHLASMGELTNDDVKLSDEEVEVVSNNEL